MQERNSCSQGIPYWCHAWNLEKYLLSLNISPSIMKNLIDLRKMVEIGVDRRSASARDYPMERFKGAVKKIHILGVRKFLIFTVGKNVPECLYYR